MPYNLSRFEVDVFVLHCRAVFASWSLVSKLGLAKICGHPPGAMGVRVQIHFITGHLSVYVNRLELHILKLFQDAFFDDYSRS